MPTSIPYDHPSLVLGNVVNTKILKLFQEIGGLQAKIDGASDKLNAHIRMKQSLGMTINELATLGLDTQPISNKIAQVDKAVTDAATNYMTVRLATEDAILKLRQQIAAVEVGDTMESPVDFGISSLKQLPLASESLKLDVQYFSFEGREESSSDIITTIEKYVKDSTENLGSSSGKLAKATSAQIYQQQKNHSVSGTLIITASCTHKNVNLIEPLYINPDKAIAIWNETAPEDGKILPKIANMEKLWEHGDSNSISIVSGVSYGSSFVGMVHLLKNTASVTNPPPDLVQKLQEKLKVGGWLENASGGFGLDPSITDDVKRILNANNISSHVSLVTMGAIPSLTSNKLSSTVEKLRDSEVKSVKEHLTSLSQTLDSQLETLETGNTKAKAMARASNLIRAKEESLIQGLGKLDIESNNVLDINSLMTAFENYVKSIQDKNAVVGTPINFYLKKITASDIAGLWIKKYLTKNTREKTVGNTPEKEEKKPEKKTEKSKR
ncbi:MAG: hypothetical protein AAGC45_05570 [Bacteroidota bacterium]